MTQITYSLVTAKIGVGYLGMIPLFVISTGACPSYLHRNTMIIDREVERDASTKFIPAKAGAANDTPAVFSWRVVRQKELSQAKLLLLVISTGAERSGEIPQNLHRNTMIIDREVEIDASTKFIPAKVGAANDTPAVFSWRVVRQKELSQAKLLLLVISTGAERSGEIPQIFTEIQ